MQQAAAVREQAFEQRRSRPAIADDQPFAWIADADTRLGPVLEAIINGRYFWVPFQRIHQRQAGSTR